MSKIVTVGATALFACILCATPLSLRLSPEGNVALSVDSASARIGRPLTATSVAGVNRRVHRRAYRRGYYGNDTIRRIPAIHIAYGYGTYQPSYDMDTRISRTTAMALPATLLWVWHPIGNGGSSDRAIGMLEKPRAARM